MRNISLSSFFSCGISELRIANADPIPVGQSMPPEALTIDEGSRGRTDVDNLECVTEFVYLGVNRVDLRILEQVDLILG